MNYSVNGIRADITIAAVIFMLYASMSSVFADQENGGRGGIPNGWWQMDEIITAEGARAIDHQQISYRHNGASYLMSLESCTLKLKRKINYNKNTVPKTAQIEGRDAGKFAYFAYTVEGDRLTVAAYSDDRRFMQAPAAISVDDGVRLIKSHLVASNSCPTPIEIEKAQATPSIYPLGEPRISAWAQNCTKPESSRKFLLDERPGAKDNIFFGDSYGITIVRYPGLHNVKNIRRDHRIKWISDDEISVSNYDKDAGWEGRITFYRCEE